MDGLRDELSEVPFIGTTKKEAVESTESTVEVSDLSTLDLATGSTLKAVTVEV